VRVAVVAYGDGDARRALGGLHDPGCGHRVRLAATPGAKDVDPVGRVAQGAEYGLAIVNVSLQPAPSNAGETFYQERLGILLPMSLPEDESPWL
jgi:hypothetical protein